MKVLFVNVPFIKYVAGQIYTGPNSGSRWPWTMAGSSFHGYAPYPFYLANGVAYLRSHGIEAELYDGVAERHANLDQVKQAIADYRPSIVVFDVAAPVYPLINGVALWAKNTLESLVVFGGPHMKVYAEDCLKQSHIDQCIVGEYELPMHDIVQRYPNGKGIYRYEHLTDLDKLPDGSNFMPYRNYDKMGAYYDPSMQTARTQLQVSTSRGCPFKCTYCQWPNALNNGKYRNRSPEAVIDEIKQVKSRLGNSLGSIFFDDDTWNLGASRIQQLCAGLKEINLPWTMMGRIDTSSPELYDLMVESGCVGMRFGIESFNQQLLDNCKKNLSSADTYNNIKHLVTKHKNMEFHFTTMKNLPGSKPDDWERDKRILQELIDLGSGNNNTIHYQNSDCIPFPGTELWEELVELGHGDNLRDFSLYDGHPSNDKTLAATIGWLGDKYTPKRSKYSGMGEPTDMPK